MKPTRRSASQQAPESKKRTHRRKKDRPSPVRDNMHIADLIDARYRAEAEKAKSDAIIAAIGDGISVQDTDFRILYQNEVHEGLFGKHAGEYCYKAFGKATSACRNCPLQTTFQDGCTHTSVREKTDAEGTRYFEITSSPLKDAAGNVIGGVEVVREVTERIRAQQALVKEKNISDMIINSLPGTFYVFDEKGKFLRWNRELEAVTEYSHEEVAAMNPLDYFRDDEKGIIGEKIKEAFDKGKATIEGTLITKSGRGIPFFFSGSRITIDGTPYLAGMGIDISRIKQTEEIINQTRQDWEDTFNTITDMITIHDKDFNIIRANRAAEKILGLPIVDTLKVKCFQYYHGTTAPPAGCPSCDCLKTGDSAAFEVFEPYLKRFIEIRAMPRFNGRNELIGLIHVVRDITERKKIEEAVHKAKTEWEKTFDNSTELIVLVDSGLNITRCNRSFAEFSQEPVREIIGRKFTDFLGADILQSGSSHQEGRTEIRTGSGRWLYVSFCPIFDEEGDFLHSIVVGTDITELKNFQKKLSDSEKELQVRVDDLEKFYEMSVGRELRMKELKGRIRGLERKLLRSEKA